MKLIKRLNQTTDKGGVSSELDILIYENNIVWYMVEHTRYDDGDEFTEDQSHDDFIKNGPPSFAEDLTGENRDEIRRIINSKKHH